MYKAACIILFMVISAQVMSEEGQYDFRPGEYSPELLEIDALTETFKRSTREVIVRYRCCLEGEQDDLEMCFTLTGDRDVVRRAQYFCPGNEEDCQKTQCEKID